MNLMDLLLNSKSGGAIDQLARQVGLNQDQVRAVIGQIAPALGQGLARNTRASGGLDGLLAALQNGNHSRYVDRPDTLGSADTIADGNGILGHILGSKDVSRSLAGQAAASTGVSADLIKQMLPLIASLAMGSLAKQNGAGGGSVTDVLGAFLDRDGDGSALDDLMGMAGKFLGR